MSKKVQDRYWSKRYRTSVVTISRLMGRFSSPCAESSSSSRGSANQQLLDQRRGESPFTEEQRRCISHEVNSKLREAHRRSIVQAALDSTDSPPPTSVAPQNRMLPSTAHRSYAQLFLRPTLCTPNKGSHTSAGLRYVNGSRLRF